MAGRGSGKFKVCLWRPKGDALLHSARFVARNPVHMNADDGEDYPLVAAPAPTVVAPAPMPALIIGPDERVLGPGLEDRVVVRSATATRGSPRLPRAPTRTSPASRTQPSSCSSGRTCGSRSSGSAAGRYLSGDLIQRKIGAYEVLQTGSERPADGRRRGQGLRELGAAGRRTVHQ